MKNKTFRLRGIPAEWTKDNVAEALMEVLDTQNDLMVEVRSIARNPSQSPGHVATVELQGALSALAGADDKDEWELQMSRSGKRVSMTLDIHFHDITPLHVDEDSGCFAE